MRIPDVLSAIGHTPLVRLHALDEGLPNAVYGKCEHLNPSGSIKDRIALAIVEAHEASGALKPGGTLAIEQHRANPGPQDPQAASGYVTEAFVIEAAERAGFKWVARSEINANPKDTKDHPFGVWTLPPQRATVPYGSGRTADPSFDRTKYDAIGESDRMTLRFTKE